MPQTQGSAPRVTPQMVKDAIREVFYVTGTQAIIGVHSTVQAADIAPGMQAPVRTYPVPNELALLTLCIAILANGFVIVGHSIPVSAENFDAELGRQYALEDVERQIYPYLGFVLRQRMAAQESARLRDEAAGQLAQ